MRMKLLGAAALGLMVAACGTDPAERTTGGAAAGAATGAGIGALGGPVGALAGAAIGGGAGAVTGAVTEPEDVNLGRPVWSDPEVRLPGRDDGPTRASAQRGSAETRDIQRALSQRGYDVGPVDGIWGPRTRAAVEEFQRSNNMQVTGRADSQLRQALNVTDTRTGGQPRDERDRAYMGGGMVPGQQDGTGGGRPNPSGPPAGGGVPAPSNNPMNDPVGGQGQATVPGMNQNR